VKNLLDIKNLYVSVNDKTILNGINLNILSGQIHAIMGPNGSGKSTLANTIMGNPKYKVDKGKILFNGQDITNMPVDKRAKLGIFLSMQNPYEIVGVTLKSFLHQSYNAIYKGIPKELNFDEFEQLLSEKIKLLALKSGFVNRDINFGFSGGEKKLSEVLQLAILQPKLVILDEIDSGLDIDALKIVCEALNKIKKDSKDTTFLIITHYPRILNYLQPDVINLIKDGKIIKSGNRELIKEIETSGYK